MYDNLQQAMQKEMTRKQFLITMGIGMAAIAGIGPIMKLLFGDHHAVKQTLGLIETPRNYGHIKQ